MGGIRASKNGRTAVCAMALALLGSRCVAQTRWCSVTGIRPGRRLVYPPIARAAHLTGTVIERITFKPEGSISNIETVLGPQMLEVPVHNQLKDWTFVTYAAGTQPCQALLVVNFDFGELAALPGPAMPTSIYVVSIRTTPFVLYDAMPSVRSSE